MGMAIKRLLTLQSMGANSDDDYVVVPSRPRSGREGDDGVVRGVRWLVFTSNE